MNMAQLHTDPETGEELPQASPEEVQQSHNYNLRPRQTRMRTKYNMYNNAQMDKTTQIKLAKSHKHIIISQMSVKEGIKNSAI